MAKSPSVHVEGLREVDAALGELGKSAGRNVMRRVAKARLEPMAEVARRMAPDDPATGGNDLKTSIAVSTVLSKSQRKKNLGKSEVEAHMGSAGRPGKNPPPHGIWQEFGTAKHGPQPFMRPAWDGGKDALLTEIGKDLWAEIEKAAARQARKALRLAAKG